MDTPLGEITVLAELLDYLLDAWSKSDDPGADDTFYSEVAGALKRLRGVETHYLRAESQLFPALERHGVIGPVEVMWETHDGIREQLRQASVAAADRDGGALTEMLPVLARGLFRVACTENEVLLPMALSSLTSGEWADVRRGEDAVGYAFAEPGNGWTAGGGRETIGPALAEPIFGAGTVDLCTGTMAVNQLVLLLNRLPVEISFIDEYDEVRYFNDGGQRIFPRGLPALGRKVQSCHPQKSLPMVNRILSEFRRGKCDEAEFWLEHKGRFVYVRYLAIRDEADAYRGCLEVAQDATHVRELEGERRLLDW